MNYNIDENKIAEQVEKQSGDFESKTEESEQKLRLDILSHALSTANRIINFNESHEKQKHFWRKFFIISFCSLLLASFIIIAILLYLGKLSDAQLGILVGSVVAEIFAILFFMVKYVHNDLYLDTFKVVTQNLLDYLVQDKNKKDRAGKE